MNRCKKRLQDESRRVDLHVGRRLRLARQCQNFTQKELAEEVGLTFQQIQKYEQGVNWISAGKLCQMGRILGVPFQFFFYDLDEAAHFATGPTLSANALETAQMLDALPESAVQTVSDMVTLLYNGTSIACEAK